MTRHGGFPRRRGGNVAVTEIVGKPMTESMLTKALRADGFSTALGGIFNTFPYTAFAQNTGLIGMTGVRSRYIVAVCGVMRMILGLFPKMAAVVASVPTMVLGGAGLAMFGMVAASGFQALSKAELHKKGNIMVVAISVAVALIPIGVPTFYSRMYTSPHLEKINERIAIDGQQLSDDDFIDIWDQTTVRLQGRAPQGSRPGCRSSATAASRSAASRPSS